MVKDIPVSWKLRSRHHCSCPGNGPLWYTSRLPLSVRRSTCVYGVAMGLRTVSVLVCCSFLSGLSRLHPELTTRAHSDNWHPRSWR